MIIFWGFELMQSRWEFMLLVDIVMVSDFGGSWNEDNVFYTSGRCEYLEARGHCEAK